MGAACSCGSKRPASMQDLMFSPIQVSSSSKDIFGVPGYKELSDTDVADLYKNEHELKCHLSLTKESLTNFFNNQMKLFPKYRQEEENPSVQIMA